LKKVTEQYKDVFVPDYYNLLSRYYSANGGPFLLGKEITYADFAVYCSIDNDDRIGTLPVSNTHFISLTEKWFLGSTNSSLQPLPESLVKFRDAFEKRPRIAEYIIAGRSSKA
jgi:glutathione S-transferase